MKILVVKSVFKKYIPEIEKYGYPVIYHEGADISDEELKDVEIVLGYPEVSVIERIPNLKYIHLSYAGSDVIADLPNVRNKVILTNSSGCFSDSIAEWVVTMTYFFYKRVGEYYLQQQDHIWRNLGETRSIIGSRVLIIGCGSIGLACAKRMKALGAYVTGVKRTPGEKPEYLDELYTSEKVDELIGEQDIIVLSMPRNKDTHHFMNEERLKMIGKDALLINVGRGDAIDTEALIPLLKEERFSAALDVEEMEPLPPESELWDLKNCLITPHATGCDTLEYTRQLLGELMLYNLDAYLNKKPLRNLVDFNTGYKVSNT